MVSPSFGRQVPCKPRLVGGVKGHNINEISFPGSPALWAGSFTSRRTFGKKSFVLRLSKGERGMKGSVRGNTLISLPYNL